jgi:hypothetical protein
MSFGLRQPNYARHGILDRKNFFTTPNFLPKSLGKFTLAIPFQHKLPVPIGNMANPREQIDCRYRLLSTQRMLARFRKRG